MKAELLKHNRFLIILALLAVGIGGNVAWQAYEDHQRAKAWEGLMEDIDCSECSARKASMTEKAEKRKAAKAALEAGETVSEPSLLEKLQAEPSPEPAGTE